MPRRGAGGTGAAPVARARGCAPCGRHAAVSRPRPGGRRVRCCTRPSASRDARAVPAVIELVPRRRRPRRSRFPEQGRSIEAAPSRSSLSCEPAMPPRIPPPGTDDVQVGRRLHPDAARSWASLPRPAGHSVGGSGKPFCADRHPCILYGCTEFVPLLWVGVVVLFNEELHAHVVHQYPLPDRRVSRVRGQTPGLPRWRQATVRPSCSNGLAEHGSRGAGTARGPSSRATALVATHGTDDEVPGVSASSRRH